MMLQRHGGADRLSGRLPEWSHRRGVYQRETGACNFDKRLMLDGTLFKQKRASVPILV